MWIDTHTHFDAPVFDATRKKDWQSAQSAGVLAQFVMGISPSNWARLPELATTFSGTYFAFGVHPLFIHPLDLSQTIAQLSALIDNYRHHPRFIGIGEIGLDGFIKDSDFQRQIDFFTAQLRLAREFDLPVFMHNRKANDYVLKYCRQFGVQKGIAHAFNGSEQQARYYLKQGFKLGFGGALTFERANNLRRLIRVLPLESFVLETDSPDMSPAWAYRQTNYSHYLPRIAQCFATIRQIETAELALIVQKNTQEATNQRFFIDKSK